MTPKRARDSEPPSFRATPLVLHVLLSVADQPAHAYGIMKEIARRTAGRVSPGPGSVHFTLSKLLDGGMIAKSKLETRGDDDERRCYYELTKRGRAFLADEIAALEDLLAVARAKNLSLGRGG
jgi:DNA-binding PadR family transcriptional regulator